VATPDLTRQPRPRRHRQHRAGAQLPCFDGQALADLAAAGLNHPRELARVNVHESMTFGEPYRAIERGELIRGSRDEMWRNAWDMARADSFAPA
jgi:hypothetical protein